MGDDYSFLQEKIKDEAGNPQTMKKKIIRMIILGVILGVVSCFTFVALHPVMKGILGRDKEEVSIPIDEEENEEQKIEEAEEKESQIKNEEETELRILKEVHRNVKSISPSIVYISGQRKIEKDTEIKKTAGVILADNGSEILILSEALSEKELKNIRVTFCDGSEHAADVKMKDNNIGIVVCAVEKEDLEEETLAETAVVKLGNSRLAKTGDLGIMLGKADKESLNVSYGFIFSGNDKFEIADGSISLLRVDVAGATFKNGVLFNQTGEMIGLLKSGVNEEQTLLSILSISDIKNELERMSNGKAVPYIGICGVALPEELNKEGIENGIYVEEIDTDSPAMKAGIQPGDAIVQIGDMEISDMNDYRKALLKSEVKDQLVLKGLRKGADDGFVEMEFQVVIGKK